MLGAFVNRVLVYLVLILGLAAGSFWFLLKYQENQIEEYQKRTADLEQQISSMKSAAALTESLQKDNAKLRDELADLRETINASSSYTIPLPADIVGVLEQLRRSAPRKHPDFLPQ